MITTATTIRPTPEPEIALVKPFSVSFPDNVDNYLPPAGAAQVMEQIDAAASRLGVGVQMGGGFTEGVPITYTIQGTLLGAPSAVEQALAAVQQIQAAIPGTATNDDDYAP